MDVNHDGVVSREEFAKAFQAAAARRAMREPETLRFYSFGALIIRLGFWGPLIRNTQNSFGILDLVSIWDSC